jgi:succinyl-CoA synthetase beta subunit
MNLHEHQAKALLAAHGVSVPAGGVAVSTAQAEQVARELGGERWVVKAQIHAGGRGKAGGVRVVDSVEEVVRAADELLGSRLVTAQTGADGALVGSVLVERASEIERELYVALVVDRSAQRVAVVASREGGVDIEELARDEPEKVVREPVDPLLGLAPFQARKLATALGLTGPLLRPAASLLQGLYRCLVDCDALQVELNPLVVTADGELLALDAKLVVDDNALHRRPELAAQRDLDAEDPKEVEASEYELNYVALEGTIGCIVNGAGLAMATMDAISLHGGRPANFLDIGGGATPEKVSNAFGLVLADPSVRAVLVNVFAGINRCDWIARGVVAAAADLQIDVPVIVRLAGTNVEEGRKILAESGLALVSAEDLDSAAEVAVREAA